MNTQEAFSKAASMADHIKEYVNNRIAAVKLQAAAASSRVLSNIVALAIVAAMMLVFAIFISMAAAFALGDWMGKTYAGFLIVSGIWLLLAVVIWFGRERLLRYPIMNRMLQEMFTHEEDPQHH